MSFLELYNEELFDLLSTGMDNSKLRIFEDSTRKVSPLDVERNDGFQINIDHCKEEGGKNGSYSQPYMNQLWFLIKYSVVPHMN